MNLKHIFSVAGRTAQQNIPAILTASAAVGVVATAALTIKATPKAMHILQKEKEDLADRLGVDADIVTITKKETVRLVWKCYISPFLMGSATILSIVGAHTIHARRSAAILSAYTLTDKVFSEYRDKVETVIGDKDSEKIKEEVTKSLIAKDQPPMEFVGEEEDNTVLCYDTLSGRYFKSKIESIRRAENDINRIILTDSYASLNDFVDLLGLKRTDLGEMIGWNLDKPLELSFTSTLTEDGRPCLSILYDNYPINNYYRMSR